MASVRGTFYFIVHYEPQLTNDETDAIHKWSGLTETV